MPEPAVSPEEQAFIDTYVKPAMEGLARRVKAGTTDENDHWFLRLFGYMQPPLTQKELGHES